jgi:hypothetical protein
VRGRLHSANRRPAVTFALGGLLVCGCLGRAQGFGDRNDAWAADLSDRTGTVSSIHVLDRPEVVGDLPSDTVRVRNVSPTIVEVAWAGGPCLDCAHFTLAPWRGDEVSLRYDLGPPCVDRPAVRFALEIRFDRPTDAAAINAVSNWGP